MISFMEVGGDSPACYGDMATFFLIKLYNGGFFNKNM